MRKALCLVAVLVMAGPVSASILGLPNDCVNGDFEADPAGTQVPTGWSKTAGGGNVRVYANGELGPGSPQGGNNYGTTSSWGTDSGRIEQYFVNPEPDEWTKTVAIGAWLYAWSFDGSGVPQASARTRLSFHMEPDPIYHPNGLTMYSDWVGVGEVYQGDQYFWVEMLIEDLPCKDFIVDIEFEQRFAVAWNINKADGVDVEHLCVPEPGSLILLALAGLPMLRRRR